MGIRDLRRFWATLDLTKPEKTRDALLAFTPRLVSVYGEAAATVAADWYDDVRGKADVRSGFRARMAGLVKPDVVAERTRFGAAHLFTEQPTGTLDFLASSLTEYMLQPGADTVTTNVRRDPAASGWHREASAGACAFCVMLADRGGVYRSDTADFASHGNCSCVAVPSWDADAPEVGVVQYVASNRTQTEADRARVRSYLASHS